MSKLGNDIEAGLVRFDASYGLGAPFAYDGLTGLGPPFGYRAGLGELFYPGARLGPYGDVAYPAAGWGAPYSVVGEGNVAVAGELPVAGTTAIVGKVPIMGAVNFGGAVPAIGSVSTAGQCACGWDIPYGYV